MSAIDSSTVDLAQGADANQGDLRRPDLAVASGPVHVVLTADNAYAFGWGDEGQVSTVRGRTTSTTACDIFCCPIGDGTIAGGTPNSGPESYDVPADQAPAGAYLYIIAWADDATTQGVIGEFIQGQSVIYTGDDKWQACATGQFYDSSSSAGPDQAAINQQIAICNAGSGSKSTTSGGWVDSKGAVTAGAVGKLVPSSQDNSLADARNSGGYFPQACTSYMSARGVDATAHWMWYSPDGTEASAFNSGGSNSTRSFIIFRLPASALIM